jgi:hypothetical protein
MMSCDIILTTEKSKRFKKMDGIETENYVSQFGKVASIDIVAKIHAYFSYKKLSTKISLPCETSVLFRL